MATPLLSIGIIFKNEIRCLERCLQSLQPIRDAIPCEVVMADTGSDDGSREVAEKYADILFDFPWINDFAAARNAVMDRCSGEWYLSIDADEWLDEDISKLVDFLHWDGRNEIDLGLIIIRNYLSAGPGAEYVDFQISRLARMASGIRYEGAIHETWIMREKMRPMTDIILHHDGYAYSDPEQAKKKLRRNMEPLRRELAKKPNDVRLLVLCMESGNLEPDLCDFARRTVTAVVNKVPGWSVYGPSGLGDAVKYAQAVDLPELEDWIALAEEMFPNSLFTRIDVAYTAVLHAWNKKDYPQCVRRAEGYFQALRECAEGTCSQTDRLYNSIMMERPSCQLHIRVLLAGSYLRMGETERAVELMTQVDGVGLNAEQTRNFTLLLHELHMGTQWDTAPLITSFWTRISESGPTRQKAAERKAAFVKTAQGTFRSDAEDGKFRPAYTLYLPLWEVCDIGRAAAILNSEDSIEMAHLLCQVERWDTLPIQALAHALECGVEFPLVDKLLNIEEMDELAARLSQDRTRFFSLAGPVLSGLLFRWGQDLAWARAVALTAVQVYDWSSEELDQEQGLTLARAFAEAEQRFLPCCYAPGALREDGLYILPPMHRFGWWCVKAFDALDAGDAAGYARCLREGLSTCNTMKPMVEFLMEHTPELKAPTPSAELLALAEQIRTILAAYPAGDPAVAVLKQSETYQKVAHLIEGTPAPIWGGQPQ